MSAGESQFYLSPLRWAVYHARLDLAIRHARGAADSGGYWHARILRSIRAVSSTCLSSVLAL